jgi:threonine/homoserine/homoserine lactone efflux protein
VIDPLTFVLAALALLATPGPTNTLLATSGAAAGLSRSLHLIVAEVLGYMLSITLLALLIGPMVQASHELNIALRVLCAVFLFYSAWKLWREGAASITSSKPVSFQRLFVATALNPKGIVFAFVIVPYLSHGRPMLGVPYMAALAALIGVVGTAWIAIGATLHAGASSAMEGGLARRAGALVLCVFATVITGSAFTA